MRLCVDCPICDTSPCRCDEDDPPTCDSCGREVRKDGEICRRCQGSRCPDDTEGLL